MPSRLVNVQFPLAGVNRKWAIQQQPPFSCYDASNVRPFDSIALRGRGGTRPGLAKAFGERVGTANAAPFSFLTDVRADFSSGDYRYDDFTDPTLAAMWSAASWGSGVHNVGGTGFDAGMAYPNDYPATTAYGNVTLLEDVGLNGSADYAITLNLTRVSDWGLRFDIYCRLSDSTPAFLTNGVRFWLQRQSLFTSTFTAALDVYASGAVTTYPWGSVSLSGSTAIMRMTWTNGTTTVAGIVNGTSVGSQNISAHGAASGTRVGFGSESSPTDHSGLVDSFRVDFTPEAVSEQTSRRIVAGREGDIWRQSALNAIENVSATPTINSDNQLSVAEMFGKLYIADYGDVRQKGVSGSVTVGPPDYVDDAGVTDWTTLGIDTDDDMVEVYEGAAGVTEGTYAIAGISVGNGVEIAYTGSAGSCKYIVQRGPKVYDLRANTLALLTPTAGYVPLGCPLVCRYRQRIVWAGADHQPHIWYMSRSGDPLDYDYSLGLDDGGRAIAGTSSEQGVIAEPITALAPVGDDYLIFGCKRSLWIMRGDPGLGGRIDNLSQTVGIVARKAWCILPGGGFLFLAHDGLYLTGGQEPVPFSEHAVPDEWRSVENTDYVSMAYDSIDHGVHLFLTKSTTTATRHWWIDINNKSFWPVDFGSTSHEPQASMEPEDAEQWGGVLMGGRDGYIRRFSRGAVNDDGTEIDAYILYGPILLGGHGYYEGILQELVGILAEASGDVNWAVFTGNTHEAANTETVPTLFGAYVVDESDNNLVDESDNYVRASATRDRQGVWTDGLNFTARPNMSGASFVLKLYSPDTMTEHWAIEEIRAVISPAGPTVRLT